MSVGCVRGVPAGEIGQYFSRFLEGRRGEILDAALAVFAEKGYEGGTMREIAARIGVTEPALYRHYAGKEALFEDMVSEAGKRITLRAGARIRDIRASSIRESLQAIMESRRQPGSVDSARPVIGVLMMAAPHHEALRASFKEHILEPMMQEVAEIIPVVDAHFGIKRDARETAGRVRAFVSLFVGSLMTSKVFGGLGEESDTATVDAMLAMMGWNTARQ